jgi:hypothetical protein
MVTYTDQGSGGIDFEKHNEEVKQVWDSYKEHKPTRVPLIFGINPRFTMFNHPANSRGTTFTEYSTNAETMIERQVEHQAWIRTNVFQDAEMGRPSDGWMLYVDFQNYYDAGWYGADIHYRDGQVPDTVPLLASDDSKWSLIEQGHPDPFTHGSMSRMWDIYAHMLRRMEEGREYDGLPIAEVEPPAGGMDGILTICCNLRGASEFFLDMLDDPEYANAMLRYVTESSVARIKAFRKHNGQEIKPETGGTADDSIQLISTQMYRDMVLPFHRQLLDELYGEGPYSIHLCGDATRHFTTIRDELNIRSFDTGFPVDFTQLRQDVGPDVEIYGGPDVPYLESASPVGVRDRVREILQSGIMEGGRYVLREGNNLAPGIPLANIHAMWDAVHEFGTY